MSKVRTIEDLLKFHFNADFFSRRAGEWSAPSGVGSCIGRLEKVSARMHRPEMYISGIADTFMQEIRRKYEAGLLGNPDLSNNQLRYLSYHLPVNDYDFLVFILSILCKSFRPSVTRGLLHSLLYKWEEWQLEEKSLILHHMKRMGIFESSAYNGMDSYLTDSGPYRLGITARREGRPITGIFARFPFPSSSISYSYFSDALRAYYREMPYEELPDLLDILDTHNNHRTDLLVLSNQVVRFKRRNGDLPDDLFEACMRRIGSPEVDVNWTLPGNASPEERGMADSARQIVKEKINSRLIKTFFEQLCDDAARRDFWMEHCDKVLKLTVYGSVDSYDKMKSRIDEELLSSHFKTLSAASDTCALVMSAESYILIEFTDVGALYVYQKGSQLYGSIFSSNIKKIDDLKTPELPSLIDTECYLSYNDEGRMIHSGYWQERLDRWIYRKLH